jgi:signal transduction histidine kinase
MCLAKSFGLLVFLGRILCAGALFAATWPATAAPFTRIQEVRDMPRSVLATNPAVYVKGIITCVNDQYQMVFVEDATGGIFIYGYSPTLRLAPGDEVEIKGVAARGRYAAILDSAQVNRIKNRPLPKPPQVSFSRVISGEFDGDRVEVQAVVQAANRRGDHLWLHIAGAENSCAVAVPLNGQEQPLDLVDTRVRVRGVVASQFKQDVLVGFQMFANGLSDIEVVERPTVNAFDAPVCPAAELSSYRGRRAGENRVHARGVVTLHWPGQATIVQDQTGGFFIEHGAPGELKVNDEVDVAAFQAPAGAANGLRHAEVRVLGRGAEPAAVPATVANARANENRLVRIMGRVVEWLPQRQGETPVLLASGSDVFSAVMRDAGVERARTAFPPGASVILTGVMRPAGDSPGSRPVIWLRSFSDLSLVGPAPASPWKWVIIAGSTAIGLGLAGVVAGLVLAARHREKLAAITARQTESEQTFDEMERQYRRAHRDRELIAQELHDNIVQSIFSVGLGIDEARRLAKKDPDRIEDRLDVAVQALNKIIRDVRAFIGGLEPKGLEGHELKTALKSVLLASGEDQEARFSLQIDATAARELTSMQATEIFSIAKEAMANAMRHSQARLTTVSLVPRGRGVRLEVVDDGLGFDPDHLEDRGLGLRNLRNRAHNIGAKLDIISSPGHGTRVIVDIPISKHDDN